MDDVFPAGSLLMCTEVDEISSQHMRSLVNNEKHPYIFPKTFIPCVFTSPAAANGPIYWHRLFTYG